MTLNPYFTAVLDRMQEIHDLKNSDYADDFNPYSNFEGAAKIAGLRADEVFQVMIGIKAERLRQLTAGGKDPNFESLEDTILDLANYAALWLSWRMREEDRLKPKEKEVVMSPNPDSHMSSVRLREPAPE